MSDVPRLQQAMLALREGRAAAAVPLFQAHLAEQPQDPQGWLFLGVSQGLAGLTTAAEASLRRAAELAPDDPRPRYNLGRLYQRDGRAAEAVAAYDAVLALDPQHAKAQEGRQQAAGSLASSDAVATAVGAAGERRVAELDPVSLARIGGCLGLLGGALLGVVQFIATALLAPRLGGQGTPQLVLGAALQPAGHAVALVLATLLGATVYNARAVRHRRVGLRLVRDGASYRLVSVDPWRLAEGYVWWHGAWPLLLLPLLLVLAVFGLAAALTAPEPPARGAGLLLALVATVAVPAALGLLYAVAALSGWLYNQVAGLTGGLCLELRPERDGWQATHCRVGATALTLCLVGLPWSLLVLAGPVFLTLLPQLPPAQRAFWLVQVLVGGAAACLPWVKVPCYNALARRLGGYRLTLSPPDGP